MKLIRLLLYTTLLFGTMACNNDEPANPFNDIERKLNFEKDDVKMRLNGDAISPVGLTLTFDTLANGENSSTANLYIVIDETLHQVLLPVEIEQLKTDKFRVYGKEEINDVEQYEIEGVLTVLPSVTKNEYSLSIDMDYTINSAYSDRTYYIDFNDSPFVILSYAANTKPETLINGEYIDNSKIQEESEKLLNEDLNRKGSKLKIELGSDGLLTLYKYEEDANNYMEVHTVRYWLDNYDGYYKMSLTGNLVDDFEEVWLMDAENSAPGQLIARVDFYSIFRFSILGNPSSDNPLNNPLYLIPTGWGHGPILREAARFRKNSDKWTLENIEYLQELANIISRELKGFSYSFIWGIKTRIVE